MEKKELQSRREFFKNAAKGVSMIGIVGFTSTVLESCKKNDESDSGGCTHCRGNCSATCQNVCRGNAYRSSSCKGSTCYSLCISTCKGHCMNTAKDNG